MSYDNGAGDDDQAARRKKGTGAPRQDEHEWRVADIPSKDWDDFQGSAKPNSKAASSRREKDQQ